MNIFTLLVLCVGLVLVWFLGKLWWRLPVPQFSKIMLTLSLFCIFPGVVLMWSNATIGSALIALGGVFSSIESHVRRKKDAQKANAEKI
jgi:hypothetical protein